MRSAAEKFKELLKTDESRKLDFKEAQYRLDNVDPKSKFVKDVLCIANAPGGDGYILLGVKSDRGKATEVVGISDHHDSSDLEQLVNGIVAPPIQFEYFTLTYQGKSCAFIHIPESKARPHRPRRNFGVRKEHIFYTRRASGNREASLPEIREMILSSTPISSIARRRLKDSKHIVDELADLSVSEREGEMYKMLKSITPKLGLTKYNTVKSRFRDNCICALFTNTNSETLHDYAVIMYPWIAKKDDILSSRYNIIRLVDGWVVNKISRSKAERLEASTLIHVAYKAIYTTALESNPFSQHFRKLGYSFANQWKEPWGEIIKWEDSVPRTVNKGRLEFVKSEKYEFFLPNLSSKAEFADRLGHLLSWVDANV